MGEVIKKPSLLSNLADLQQSLNRMFDPTLTQQDDAFSHLLTSDWVPTIDVKDKGGKFIIHADIPGVQLKDIEVSADRNILSIRGQKEARTKDEKKNFVRYERSRGAFYRSITLPEMIIPEKIHAKFKNGVLEIIAPKNREGTKKRVRVK